MFGSDVVGFVDVISVTVVHDEPFRSDALQSITFFESNTIGRRKSHYPDI